MNSGTMNEERTKDERKRKKGRKRGVQGRVQRLFSALLGRPMVQALLSWTIEDNRNKTTDSNKNLLFQNAIG